MRGLVEQYAQDESLFFAHYAAAHVKMSELGCEDTLLSEFPSNRPTLNAPQLNEKEGIILGSHADPQQL
jgi:hypothetical protein